MRTPGAWLYAIVLGSACASGATAPRETQGITFTAGNAQSDTIQSTLSQALVVQTAANQVVEFIGVLDTAANTYEAYPGALTVPYPQPDVTDTSNASGQAAVIITLGTKPGRARLVVKVPARGYVDTAVFTVTVGNAAGLEAGPADSAAYVGHSVALHTRVTDRFGNPRTDPVSYSLISGPATLAGATTVITGLGQVLIMASADGFADTTFISGVPSGTIAASLDPGGIAVFGLDGSGYTRITNEPAGNVVWAPSGTTIVFDQTNPLEPLADTGLLESVALNGAVSVLDNPGGSGTDAWPTYSPDGTWIYYAKGSAVLGDALWRVHPDGTGDAPVPMQSPLDGQFPSVSPDGTEIVYIAISVGTMEILNIASGISTNAGSIAGESAAWAPDGDLIAFRTAAGTLALVHSDGSGLTQLGTARYLNAIGWSPDGQWVIARNAITLKLDLLSVTSNLVIPVGFTGNLGSPSWH
jgi:hypothetical protein